MKPKCPRKLGCHKLCDDCRKRLMSEQENNLNKWLEDRPEIIHKLANKLKPWSRYRIKETGQHCCIYSYSEDGTVTVTVDGHDEEILSQVNALIPVNVFGLTPNDLEEIQTGEPA